MPIPPGDHFWLSPIPADVPPQLLQEDPPLFAREEV
jgi:hypothetical protein